MRTIRSVLRGSGPNALHREIDDENQDEIGLVPTDGTRFRILFLPVADEKAGTNRLHLDLTTTSIDDQNETVARLVEIGARHIDIGQSPDEGHVVLADPEGNEFCIIEPDNLTRMAIGLGSGPRNRNPRAGRHRSAHHLGWSPGCPEDREEPASPRHCTARPRRSASRSRPPDLPRATRVDIGQGAVDWLVMVDPDGNEFCVLSPG
jgi:hypothetical protein